MFCVVVIKIKRAFIPLSFKETVEPFDWAVKDISLIPAHNWSLLVVMDQLVMTGLHPAGWEGREGREGRRRERTGTKGLYGFVV